MIGEYYNMDCMELMAKYPDKHFDLAIVDPPYGIHDKIYRKTEKISKGSKFSNFYSKKQWDHNIPNALYFNELFRVSKNQIIWGGNYMTNYLYPSRCWIIWDKLVTNFTSINPEMAWTSFDLSIKIFKRMASIDKGVMNKEIVSIHPTQKPIKLYEWILTKYAKPTDVILDTHVGSASSLIACENTGNKYVGCELDKDYYEASLKRLTNHCKQGKLFT